MPIKWSSPPKPFMPSTSASMVSTPATGAATTTGAMPKMGSRRKEESSIGVCGASSKWESVDEFESRTPKACGPLLLLPRLVRLWEWFEGPERARERGEGFWCWLLLLLPGTCLLMLSLQDAFTLSCFLLLGLSAVLLFPFP